MTGSSDEGPPTRLCSSAGDLAYKMLVPALYHMVRRGTLAVPVVGVAGAGWDLPRLRDHARDSIAQAGAGVGSGARTRMRGEHGRAPGAGHVCAVVPRQVADYGSAPD
jgi:Glucose-6-phosphate dehydrogenase, NAD binding domain